MAGIKRYVDHLLPLIRSRGQRASRSADAPPVRIIPSARTSSRKIDPGPIRKFLRRLALAGTHKYPPDTQRRLKILNLIAILISATTFVYAMQMLLTDYTAMKPVIFLNLALALLAALVPFAHRINDTAGGLLLVGAEFAALMGFAAYFGRSGGAPLQYVVAAAAPFVVFGLKRLKLVLAVVVAALGLHLTSWFSFTRSNALLVVDHDVLDSLYVQGAITTFGLIAASVYYAFSLAEKAKEETDMVLRNVLPDSVVERLKLDPDAAIADGFAQASILFADITGFVSLARKLGPEQTVALLNDLVTAYDALAEHHGVEKIKTIGDAYMVASGVPIHRPDHVLALAGMAKSMIVATAEVASRTGHPINVRIGMAAGPMMAGVIGRRKFTYDVWGDPVNLASRLEAASAPGLILVCPICYDALAGHYVLETRGPLDIKGVGAQEAWFLRDRIEADPVSLSNRERTPA